MAEAKPWEKYQNTDGPWSKYAIDDNIDTSPYELPAPVEQSFGGGLVPEFTVSPQPYDEDARALAQSGVDVQTGAPVAPRFNASFAKDNVHAVAYLSEVLDTRIRKGPDSGEPEYLRTDPETGKKRWTLVDEEILSGKDIGEIGKILPLLGAGAGGVVGAPGTPVIQNLTMAAGAGLGEVLRLAIGEMLGVNDVDTKEYVWEGGKVTAFDALLGWGANKFMNTYKALRQMVRPVGTEAEEASLALYMMENRRTEELAEEIQRLARTKDAGARFRPTTAQHSGDEYLLAIEDATLRGDMRNAVEISRREVENESTLELAFDAITKQSDDYAALYRQGEDVTSIAGAKVEREIDAAADALKTTKSAGGVPIAKIADIEEQEGGRALRTAVWEARKTAKRKEIDAWNRYKEAYGWDGAASSDVKITKTPKFQEYVEGVNEEKLAAWYSSTKTGKGKLVPEAVLGKKGKDIQILGPKGEVLASISQRSNEPLDLHQLEVALKELKRWSRINSKNEVAGDAAGFDIARMIDELEQLKRDTLDPTLLNLSDLKAQATTDRVTVFDKGALRSIIKKDGSDYIMDDSAVFGYVIGSNDREAAKHLMKILGKDPGATLAAKKSLWSLYKKEVAPDGYVDPKLHKSFMKRRGNTIDEMFSPSEIKRMNTMHDMGRVVQKEIKRYDSFVKDLNKTFAGKIKNTDPENIASTIFSKKMSSSETRELMLMLDNYGMGDSVREVAGTYVKSQLMRGGRLSETSLKNMLDPAKQNVHKLKRIFGEDYVSNLEKIKGAAAMIRQRAQRSLVPGKTNAFTDLMRVLVAPPLTRKGRAQTLLVNIRYDAANRALSNALLNPKELERIVRLSFMQARNKRVVRTLAQLGGSFALTEIEAIPPENYIPFASAPAIMRQAQEQ